MPGIGTIANMALIIAGGITGAFGGRLLKESHQDTLTKACGVCVLFIGMNGALPVMEGKSLFIVVVMSIGALIGEFLDIEGWFERLGQWLKIKSGNAGENRFIEGFLLASLTVSVGAMAIVGAINDGMFHDPSMLVTKGIIDFFLIMAFTAALGKGCIFSAVPVGIIQGTVTALAVWVAPIMTETATANLSLIGSILIFCVGINLVWGSMIRVANLLPAVVVAVLAAFIPFTF